MKLEDQVCSLELAKRLNELRVNQESAFWWIGEHVYFSSRVDEFTLAAADCAAFTVAELVSQLQEIEREDIIVALSDKHVADTLAMRLCTKLQDLKESAGSGPTL